MDFYEKMQDLARKIEKQKNQINTEQATNTAFVLPFINALGYDIFNPIEVVPEYTADHGIKKGEKVDYAIQKDDDVIMIFECKKFGTNLDNLDISQLYRYFSVVSARIGVLTDGATYRFYTDLDQPNNMDAKPFLDINLLEINLLDLQPQYITELKKLTKDSFDIDKIISTASELKYTRQIKIILTEELKNPTDEFIKFFASKVYSGMITQKVKKQFSDITRRAFQQFIKDMINTRLKSAMSETTNEAEEPVETEEDNIEDSRIVTTDEEIDGFHIVKAILSEIVDPDRIFQRDRINYFGVLLDDNNRKPLCRLHFNSSQKCIGLFDNNKKEEKVSIECLKDIYKYADRLKNTVSLYES